MSAASDVAKNLRLIEDMAARLEARAIDRANSPDGIVGGDAMVELAYVGSLETWANRVDGLERRWRDLDLPAVDMPNWCEAEDPDEFWPASELLWFWSEDYRRQLGMDYDAWRPTLASEAGFLRNADVAVWIWDNEVKYDDFAADVERAKSKLENILIEGQRTIQGVPCLYDECKGRRLQRKLRPKYDKDGERVRDARGHGLWDFEYWTCPKCKRTWDEDDYARHVTAAHERTKVEDIDGATWCTADYAARKVDRSVKTIRTWINRSELVTLCMIAGRRLPFVNLEDVRELAEGKPRRRTHAA